MIKNYKTYAVLWLQMPQHLSNTKKMMMNVSKNKAFLIAGVALLGLGVGAYFLFFRQKEKLPPMTPEKKNNDLGGYP